MKTRFGYDLNIECFVNSANPQKAFDDYLQKLAESGWVYNDELEEIQLEIEKEINLSEGDRVILDGDGFYMMSLVEWKAFDILNDLIIYHIEEE